MLVTYQLSAWTLIGTYININLLEKNEETAWRTLSDVHNIYLFCVLVKKALVCHYLDWRIKQKDIWHCVHVLGKEERGEGGIEFFSTFFLWKEPKAITQKSASLRSWPECCNDAD